jgi:Tol biopolymer transport system component
MKNYQITSILLVTMFIGGCTSSATPTRQCQIAFHASLGNNSDIYIMGCDGENWIQLTDHLGSDLFPDWSPDGKRIAYRSDRDDNSEIYIMNTDGNRNRNFSNHPANDLEPAWSPDGKWIAFISDRDGDYEIYIQEVEGEEIIQITDNQYRDIDPTWSPDGEKLAFVHGGEDDIYRLFIVSLTDLTIERVLPDFSYGFSPAWSPDGEWIAFVSSFERNHEIFVVNVQNWEYKQLTHDTGGWLSMWDDNPSWSPDSSQIVFQSNREDSTHEIYIMNRDGSEMRRITNNDLLEGGPDWRP